MQEQPAQRSIILGDFNYNIHLSSGQHYPTEWNSWLLSTWHDPLYDETSMRPSATFHRGNTTIDFILCSPDLRHHIT
ncbi:predicted protein [Lichtheimia corymbifera JMRC:FSU:9682]|uniref:Endonuclease/exonuclease/phosphatase domain-containing protein n=1 Tax=Lichtheimia corymbifera JMRC:FSU:9682 TaxID=1263082 RepID=A0A068SEJ2_9FUNG|nr:predicted protein [Lichtheimia corymbifera JMRC:FSU:9682]